MIDTIQFLLFVRIRTNNGPNRTALPARCFRLWVTVDTSGADGTLEEPDTNSKTIRRLTGVSERTQFRVCALLRDTGEVVRTPIVAGRLPVYG
jgi:hypothetical protein